MLANCSIKVVPHHSMNPQKGVIRCRGIYNTTEEEILENVSAQSITEVKKIRIQRVRRRKNTGIIILTFGPSILPVSVKIRFLRVMVDAYIPTQPVSESLPVPNVERQVTIIRNVVIATPGISFRDARKISEKRGNTPITARSYSDVTGVAKCSVAFQTDMTCP